jgi:hypothetical protein
MTAVAMPWSAFLAAGIGAIVVALHGYAFWRARSEAKPLRCRLKSATTSLEQLKLSFASFAPQEVVERIIASRRRLEEQNVGRTRIDVTEVLGQRHPRHLGDRAGHLDASRARADLNERQERVKDRGLSPAARREAFS